MIEFTTKDGLKKEILEERSVKMNDQYVECVA